LQTMAQSNEKIVNVFNWADYIGTDTVKNFEKEYGIKVNYDEYESSEMVEAKLLSGRTGYDIVVHSSMYSKRLFPLNIFQKLDKTKLTNWKLLDPKLMAILDTFDPGNNFMAPYSWGSTGIAYNVDMVLERLPDAPLDSGDMLFNPEVVSKFKDCGVSLLDSPTDVVPQALVHLGYPDNTRDPKAIQAAEDLLLSVRPTSKNLPPRPTSMIYPMATCVCLRAGRETTQRLRQELRKWARISILPILYQKREP